MKKKRRRKVKRKPDYERTAKIEREMVELLDKVKLEMQQPSKK